LAKDSKSVELSQTIGTK